MRVAETGSAAPDRVRRWTDRIHWIAACAPLIALAFVQRPGWIVPDTKLDLTANPGGFLARALSLWDPLAAGGQLQNQAYGYLFPMGPFFWLGEVAGLPSWVTQRLWWALILVVAFVGMRLVLARLGVGTTVSRLIASYAFALSPRMLIGLGAISSEIWPMALAPWVLLPLIRIEPGGERSAAWRSAVAVLLIGAVNAAATLAALVPAGLWIVTRIRVVRWRLLAWWALAVTMASAWWIGPLLLLGRYSPPFLDWIESASVTNSAASLTEASRGTTQWLAGIVGSSGPLWPAGFQVLTERPVVLLGMILAAAGLIGVWWARAPWSLFVRLCLLSGLLLVTLGHLGPGQGAFASQLSALLDGPLAPFRNTHKFEPVVRLPLAIGLAHALPRIHAALRVARAPWPRIGYAVTVICIVGQAAAPALMGVSQRGPFLGIPDYWPQAARYLAEQDDGGRSLVLPGVNGVASVWGSPRDEPLQPFAESPWITRDGVPLGSAATTRILNDIEMRVASGVGGPELRTLLDRLAVSRVVLREDLAPAPGAVPGVVARASLRSAGLVLEHRLGPLLGPADPNLVSNFGFSRPAPAIEIYAVPDAATIAPVELTPVSDFAVVTGGPEAATAWDGDDQPFVVSSDAASVLAISSDPDLLTSVVMTDSLQRREANFAAVRDNYGPLLHANDAYTTRDARADWLPDWLRALPEAQLAEQQTTAAWLRGVTANASSTLARPAFGQQVALATGPERAFDLSEETSWQSAGRDPVGQWVEVHWPDPIELPERIRITFDVEVGTVPAAVVVHTDGGSARTPLDNPNLAGRADPKRFVVEAEVPLGRSTSLRLEVAAVRDSRPTVRVADVGVSAVPRAERWLDVPASPFAKSPAFAVEVSRDSRPSCVPTEDALVVCHPGNRRPGEEEDSLRRAMRVPAPTTYEVEGTVLPRTGSLVERLLQRPDGVVVDASSVWVSGSHVAAPLAADGDPLTYWAADPEDDTPTLTLTWPEPRLVEGLEIESADAIPGRSPTRISVVVDGRRTFARAVPPSGSIRLPGLMASSIAIEVMEAEDRSTLTSQGVKPLPVTIGEARLIGPGWYPPNVDRSSPVGVPCGFGPTLRVNGTTLATEVAGTRGELIAGLPLAWRSCDTVPVDAGSVELEVIASSEFTPRSVRGKPLAGGQSAKHEAGAAVTVLDWQRTRRAIEVATVPVDSVLTVRENSNVGWTATLNGSSLQPVTVDGWAQGWKLPSGAEGEVELEFRPQGPFLVSLGAGAISAMILLLLASRDRRPLHGGPVLGQAQGGVPVRALALFLGGMVIAGWAGALIVLLLAPLRLASLRTTTLLLSGLAVAWITWASWAPWPQEAASNRSLVSQLLAWAVISLALAGPLSRRIGMGPSPDPVHDGALEEVPAGARQDDRDE